MKTVVLWSLPLVLAASPAWAQTQIKPRVLLMVDTSGSMTEHMDSTTDSDGDGSTTYTDLVMTRSPSATPGFQLYPGKALTNACTATATYDGVNSRMFAAKSAVGNVVNGSGDVEWGLMRYTGNTCPFVNTFTLTNGNCTNDNDCNNDEFCVGGKCGTDDNLCFADHYGASDGRGTNGCTTHYALPDTYSGTCGTSHGAGNAACATAQTCFQDSDCNGAVAGRCALVGTGPVKTCQCGTVAGTNFGTCSTNYTCTANRCVFNEGCRSPGGTVLVDPSAANSSTAVANYVDGIEDYRDSGDGVTAMNPELRAVGNTPLAGAARSAALWYNAIKAANSDAQITCRPYVLVQITDGLDSCDTDTTNGPAAGAQAFVAATAPGARVLNKVYVIGLAFGGVSSPSLDAIAAAGGTGTARLANSVTDIEAALADIVSSSVLVEKCNNADDDCNGACDEPFPDVLVNNAACSNRHPANSCDNGQLAGTHCFASGTFVCSADQLSEVCSAATCATNPALCPTVETCNGTDDDCNGVVDDCTPFVPNSCCTNKCPACNPTGVPQPETCNGCDDDCDGVADNHLTDTGIACGLNVGDCVGGTTACCQQTNPTTGTCTTDPVSTSATAPVHTNNDKLFCLGGVAPASEVCDGTDNDCNGVVDDISRSCFPFATGMAGVGICRSGVQACTATPCGTAPNACCPAGWPAGKPCPGAAMFGACSGAVGPQPETCNGIDDDCNGTVDNNVTDVWAGTPCCPTGNNADCTNTGTGTRCKLGAFQCVGGAKQCVGGIAKSPETCNGVDDDCNGAIDDNIPGNGQACSGGSIKTGGVCKAQFQCKLPAGTGPNGLTCVQTTGPATEICNGLDDDCNGVIDDPSEVAANDPRVGVVGGSPCIPLPAGQMQPPCNPGTTACVNGMIVCQGEVQPQPNQCNGISTDCTGNPNTMGNCPTGFQCYQGNCEAACSGGEFPCPGGFVAFTQNGQCICIPDGCAKLNCPTGQICNLDNTGTFVCVDPCASVSCPQDFICKGGVCVDNTCKTQGCPPGDICSGEPPTCIPDPCTGVTCPAGEFCQNGNCISPCNPACPTGKICQNGACVNDPCNLVSCNSGQVCRDINGTGTCVDQMCATTCNTGMTCCGGTCMDDPCPTFACPMDTTCKLDSACNPSCQTNGPKDQIVGAGGGGFACSAAVGGASDRGGAAAGVALLLLAIALAGRRRRAR